MEPSTPPKRLEFGEFCRELLENCRKPETEDPFNIINNQSLSNDQDLANEEVRRICSNMYDLKLDENRYESEYQPAPSTSYGSGSGSSLSATSFRPMSVLDDPILKEELRKGSLHWDEDKVVHYATLLMDEEIQLLQYLIDFSQDQLQLFSAVKQFLSNEALVINAAFNRNGSVCLQKLTKKIKKTVYAYNLTRVLATQFHNMMIHPSARLVILKCFEVFGPGPNLVLYDQAIKCFLPLAKHELGCFSLKVCIDTIGGEERWMLLKMIAECSLPLSIDPHGNYVLQHVLGLRISTVNHEIMFRLFGHFVSISQTKEGSHVTEKLMECYDIGAKAVVQEILNTPDAAYLLSRHPFGNYVVQKALVITKNDVSYRNEYTSLVEALRPHFKELGHTVGKHVINQIKHEFVGLKKHTSAY